ncbi:hypothetical protein [Streptomyces sp. NPDC020607]|uniref:hypothetical protein n=1 Tax=Streptomyces sp. NPDC020607 TaxID=3365082 RepID=UPI00378DFE8B
MSPPDLRPEFVQQASAAAIRAQYERAQRMVDLWDDRARALFLLLCQREDEERTT